MIHIVVNVTARRHTCDSVAALAERRIRMPLGGGLEPPSSGRSAVESAVGPGVESGEDIGSESVQGAAQESRVSVETSSPIAGRCGTRAAGSSADLLDSVPVMETDPDLAHAGHEWPSSRETTWGLIAVSAGLVLGIAPAQVVPILLGAAVGSGLSLSWAGGLATAELGALALASWGFGSKADTTRTARWLPAAFLGIGALQGLSAVLAGAGAVPTLLGVRILVGLAEGFVVATVYATIAGFANAQALYGRALQLVILLSVVLLPGLASLLPFGLRGPYGGLAALAVLLGVLFLVARRRAASGGAPVLDESSGAAGGGAALDVPVWVGWLGAAGAGLVAFGDGLVYAFVERIGSGLGLGSSIGWLLAASSLCGAAGAGWARGWTPGRNRSGLALGLGATMAAALFVSSAPRLAGATAEVELLSGAGLLFAAGVLAKGASYFFAVTLILGVVAHWSRAGDADDRGWAPTVGGLIPLCASLGPLVGAAGLGALGADYLVLGLGSAAASLLGLALLWPGAGTLPADTEPSR